MQLQLFQHHTCSTIEPTSKLNCLIASLSKFTWIELTLELLLFYLNAIAVLLRLYSSLSVAPDRMLGGKFVHSQYTGYEGPSHDT